MTPFHRSFFIQDSCQKKENECAHLCSQLQRVRELQSEIETGDTAHLSNHWVFISTSRISAQLSNLKNCREVALPQYAHRTGDPTLSYVALIFLKQQSTTNKKRRHQSKYVQCAYEHPSNFPKQLRAYRCIILCIYDLGTRSSLSHISCGGELPPSLTSISPYNTFNQNRPQSVQTYVQLSILTIRTSGDLQSSPLRFKRNNVLKWNNIRQESIDNGGAGRFWCMLAWCRLAGWLADWLTDPISPIQQARSKSNRHDAMAIHRIINSN